MKRISKIGVPRNVRRELAGMITKMVNHGWDDTEIAASLRSTKVLVELGRMVTTEDLVAIIRDLLTDGEI